ncbi:FG-GAP repeat domain-containing protein [Cribrihabitans neustonicus]|uniref:FG-GAP repeat domain-containing protein n=1 Tax=Cribrihabitans neustonicus TaxID=1429085 RepID=UPI003B5B57A2
MRREAGARRLPVRPWLRSARRAGAAALLWLTASALPAAGAETRRCIEGGGQYPAKACYTGNPEQAPYGHGVLGRTPEWQRLVIFRPRGGQQEISQPDHIFEDTAPRLADVTGDGRPEILAVQSSFSLGARLVIYGLEGGPEPLAATPYIGRRNRWLAPVGAADLDGDGHVEIAYVDRPHLAKVLRIWRFKEGALTEVASLPGVTNHQIGQEVITAGLRACGAGPELLLVSADWRRIVAVRLAGGEAVAREVGPFRAEKGLSGALACP